MRAKIALLLLIFGVGGAFAAPQVVYDASGNLLQSWLEGKSIKIARSPDQGRSFAPTQTLPISVESFDLAVDPNSIHYLIFGVSREVYFTRSSGNNLAFLPPRRLAGTASAPRLISNGDKIFAAWRSETPIAFELKPVVYLTSSKDGGETWLPAELIAPTGESISQLELRPDGQNGCALVLVTTSQQPKRSRLYYYSAGTGLKKLVESFDPIISSRLAQGPAGPLILWQQRYLDRTETQLITSLDGGLTFSSPKPIEIEPPIRLFHDGDKWRYLTTLAGTFPTELALKELFPPAAQNYEFTVKKSWSVASLEAATSLSLPNPALWTISLSPDQEFFPLRTKTITKTVLPGSVDTTFPLPTDLADGAYFTRLKISDGLTTFTLVNTPVFKLDRTAPVLAITSSQETLEIPYRLTGRLNETAILSINNQSVALSPTGTFELSCQLSPGPNTIFLTATDEAGNSIRHLFSVNYAVPTTIQLKLIKPTTTDWLRPGATVFLELQAIDPKNELEDEVEAGLTIGGQSLAETLIYDKANRTFSGIIPLPAPLKDGSSQLEIKLLENHKTFQLNIDATPPTLTVTSGATVYGKSPFELPIPITDLGSGLDLSGTIVKVGPVSCEVFGSGEALMARSRLPLTDGTYEVTVLPRDRVGNSGPALTYRFCVDTLPPRLGLDGTPEVTSRQTLLIKGAIEDRYLTEVVISNNGKKIGSYVPSSTSFSIEVPVLTGNNLIMVEGRDLAGNSSAQTISYFSAVKAFGTMLTEIGNAPNPFSPQQDGQTYFICRLGSGLTPPIDVKIYIFNLTGELIWKKEYNATATNIFTWDGRDHFGLLVANGLYPYAIALASNGKSETMRGKLIVYR
ncbi:MAG: hypothetical protein WC500_02360 [Candidatus Margulisiibacteriota bacterium]